MHPIRKKRFIWISIILILIAAATTLALFALRQNINLFFTPQQVAAGLAPRNHAFRVGGWVVAGSVQHEATQLDTTFMITDHFKTMVIYYHGILPDLFRDGQAVVVDGEFNANNQFIATQVLAKHDENYTPPPLRSLEKN